jgi:hypothetical protein
MSIQSRTATCSTGKHSNVVHNRAGFSEIHQIMGRCRGKSGPVRKPSTQPVKHKVALMITIIIIFSSLLLLSLLLSSYYAHAPAHSRAHLHLLTSHSRTCAHTRTRTHAHMHTHTHPHTHTQTQTHTHTHIIIIIIIIIIVVVIIALYSPGLKECGTGTAPASGVEEEPRGEICLMVPCPAFSPRMSVTLPKLSEGHFHQGCQSHCPDCQMRE